MCSPENVMQQEHTYLSRLPLASTWIITDGTTLTIFDVSGKALLSYTKATFTVPK
jgi:hypothetical protein